MYLDPETYDRAEEAGAAILPNRIVECCEPAGFHDEGYPTRVRSVKAVGRYVDVMHEGRLAGAFDQILGGAVTKDEMDLMREVAQIVQRLSVERYGRAMVPKDALARGLNIYRHVRFLYPAGRATVLEIGGGSGYVGAMLSLAGYTYISTDITQAFYLFQNHLMNTVTPARLVELATDPRSFGELKEVPQGWAVHVPWWKFVVPEPSFPLPVDLVTANHCLCEMHPRALAYTLKVCGKLLANRGAETCFLFEGWGSTTRNPIWSVNKKFAECGYGIAHNDTLASVYVRSDGPLSIGGVMFPKTWRPQPAQPAQCVNAGESPEGGFLMRLLRTPKVAPPAPAPTPTMEDLWHPVIWSTPENPVSQRLVEGRKRSAQDGCHKLEDFVAMLREVLGHDEIQSDDEKFLRYIDTAL
jgi:hypothetical protein